jgi:hypothetical protein
MALTLLDGGGQLLLDILFGDAPTPTNIYVELCTGPITIDVTEADTATTQDGISREFAARTDGTADGIDLNTLTTTVSLVGGIPTITWSDAVWTFGGALENATNKTIRSYVVTVDGDAVFAEMLDEPFQPTNPGDKLTGSLQFRLGNVSDAGTI